MTAWDERFEAHPVFPHLEQTVKHLDESEEHLADVPQREAQARLRRVVEHTRDALGAVDPELVSSAALDAIASHLASVISYLQQFIAAPAQSHLDNANGQADAILAQLPALSPATTTKDVEGLQQAVTSFRRSVGQHTRNVEEEVRVLREKAQKLEQQLAAQEEQVGTQITAQEAKVAAQETRIDTVVGQFQTQFSEEQAQRTSQFSEVLEKARTDGAEAIVEAKDDIEKQVAEAQTRAKGLVDTTKATTEKELKELRDDVAKRVEELNEFRAEAERAVGATGSAVLAGGYQKTAKSEQRSANFWRVVSVLAFIGATLVAAYAVRHGVTDEFKPSRFFAKITIGLPIIALAYYAAHESGKHREQARLNKQIELQLASLDAYLRELPEDDRHQIKGDLADGFFETGFRAVEAATRRARRKPAKRAKADL